MNKLLQISKREYVTCTYEVNIEVPHDCDCQFCEKRPEDKKYCGLKCIEKIGVDNKSYYFCLEYGPIAEIITDTL